MSGYERMMGRGLLLFAVALVVGLRMDAQTISEQYLLAAANQDRALHQLAPVRLDARLTRAAYAHAEEMARHGGISHQFAGEAELAERASSAGAKFSVVSENVAEASNAALIHSLWMHSEGHRANLLDARVDSVGIAVVSRNGELYAVEDFSRSVASLSLRDQEASVALLLEQAGLGLAKDAQIEQDARATCKLSTGYAGARKPWFVMRYTAADLHELPGQLTERISTGKYHAAAVGACEASEPSNFTSYNIAVLLYP